MSSGNAVIDPSIPSDADARAYLAALDAKAEHLDVQADGLNVRWRRFGSGQPLVLLHGGHGSWMHWVRNVVVLGRSYSVWLPDMPGYGDSDAPSGTDLRAVVDPTLASLGAVLGDRTDFALVGFSFGGLVAAHLAARCPRVRRLALIGPAGHGSTRRPRGALRSWKSAQADGDREALAEVMRHNLGLHMLSDVSVVDPLALELHTRSCLRTRFRSKPLSLTGDLKQALDRFDGSLLMAWGEHDVTATPQAAADALSVGRPDCRTVIVNDAGHWLPYEQAQNFNALLLDWLETHKKGDRP